MYSLFRPVSYHEAVSEPLRLESKQDSEFEQFARLRHWAFLLNLERAKNEVDEVAYPEEVLVKKEVKMVLSKRVSFRLEPQFFI
jgi:hypothetical protein